MPRENKDRRKMLEDQLENTLERMEETQETLEHDDIPDEEANRIQEKQRHRKEQIAGLRSELADEKEKDSESNEFHRR